jgi:hypothetical protein
MAFPLITEISFDEEKRLNDPIHSMKWVLEQYRATFDPEKGHGLYEWEPMTFANTEIVQRAGQHFKKYGRYNDIMPKSRHYKAWWDREEYRRKEGITVPIKVPPGGANSDKDLLPVWIPGSYYGQLNYGPIKRTVDPTEASAEKAMKNSLEIAETLNKEREMKLLYEGLSSRTVADKTYDFPDFWDGHFHTYVAMEVAKNLGLDFATLKSRRKGFSYVGAWKAHDLYDLYPNSLTLLIAFDLAYLNKGKEALFNMILNYADFINLHTDWSKGRLIDNTDQLKSGYTVNGVEGEFGFKSEIICLSARDNPNCARGKDAQLILWEETGSFPNLIATKDATKAAAETGGYVTGQNLYWGTVGKSDADSQGLSAIFYDPFGHDCLPYKNVYSPQRDYEACAQFFGQYQNLLGAIDKDGNSDFAKAKEIDDVQDKVKKRDQKNYFRWRAERARNPEEALSPMTNNLFSPYKDKITFQIQRLETTLKNIGKAGIYMKDKSGVALVTNDVLKDQAMTWHPPIDDTADLLPKSYDPHGCIIEYSTPFRVSIPSGNHVFTVVPEGLYEIWHDPFATDKDAADITLTNSSGTAYVYERPNSITGTGGGRIVASWIGRPSRTEDYNEQLFLMCERWNAKMLYENDRGTVYEYAVPRKLTKWLIEEPELLSMKELSGRTGRKFGVSIGKHAERLSKGLLMLFDFLGNQMGTDIEGNPQTFIDTFYCKRALRQLLKYGKGNYDSVSALIVGQYSIIDRVETEVHARNPTMNINSFWNRDFF